MAEAMHASLSVYFCWTLFFSSRKEEESRLLNHAAENRRIGSPLTWANGLTPRYTWQISSHTYGGGEKRISATCMFFPNMLWEPLWRHILPRFSSIWLCCLLQVQKRLGEKNKLSEVCVAVHCLQSGQLHEGSLRASRAAFPNIENKP